MSRFDRCVYLSFTLASLIWIAAAVVARDMDGFIARFTLAVVLLLAADRYTARAGAR